MELLPKLKAEIVVSSIPVQTVVDTARQVLYTGHMGDGKIFIYNVENVVRVSSGAQGMEALDYEV
jgi:Amt family ammonium transporter